MGVENRLRDGVRLIRLDEETLVVEPDAGVLIRLPSSNDDEVEARALRILQLDGGAEPLDRRSLLQAAGTLGVAAILLPAASAAASRVTFTSATGTVAALDANIFDGYSGSVNDIALRDDGSILVVGGFGKVGATFLANVALLSSTGALDDGFAEGYDAYNNVESDGALAVLDTGSRILVGASYTSLLDLNTGVTADLRFPLHAVTEAGAATAVLSAGTAEPSTRAQCLAQDGLGRVLVGGAFANIGGVAQAAIARIHPNGVVDTSFAPALEPWSDVRALAVSTHDGTIVIGGFFSMTVGGVTRSNAARLFANGGLDPSFDPDVDGNVEAVAFDADRGILLGGTFWNVGSSATPTERRSLARFEADGTFDATFDAEIVDGAVLAIAVQSDEGIVIGGTFTELGGVGGFTASSRYGLARLESNGALDTTLPNLGIDGDVRVIRVEDSGDLLIGGTFTRVGGEPRTYLARIT